MSVKKQQPSAPPGARTGLAARLAAAGGMLRGKRAQRLIAGAVLFTLLVGSPLALLRTQSSLRQRRPAEKSTLSMLAALDQESFSDARRIAEQVDRKDLSTTEQGGLEYVLAAVAAQEGDELWGQEKKDYFLLAAKHMELARERGYPRALDPEGLYLFGRSLYLSGRVAESLPILEKALEETPQHATEIHLLLSGAYRQGSDPDLQQAMEHNREYLADPELSETDRENGMLEEARLLWQQDDFAACSAALDRIPADAFIRPEVELLRGQIRLRSARELKEKLTAQSSADDRQAVKNRFEETIKALRRAQDDPLGDQAIRQSMYLIGVCLLEMGDTRAALAQFQRTRDLYFDTPEGIAAGLQDADLLLEAGRDEPALDSLRQMLAAIPDTPEFSNPWIPTAEFRTRVLTDFQHYVDASQYDNAISLTESLFPLFPRTQAVRLAADTHRAWARSLLHTAETLPHPQSDEMQAKARAQYRKAGQVFGQLAQLEFTTRNYPDDVWQSAESFLAGHRFTEAVAALDEYLKYELRRRRPLALVNLGESLLSLGRIDDALLALAECIEFYPDDAASFQARLWAARANSEKGDVATAETLLRENLNGELLTPESKEWRDSLFALGKLLADAHRHAEAIERLEEAVSRYPDSRQSIEARYLIAEACQQAAKAPQEKALTDTVETARIAHLKQAQQYLETAVSYYEQTQEVLNRRQEQTELSTLEKSLLRNSYFAAGAALVELGRDEDAVRAYSTATNRYQHDPEVLEAFAQIATCYRRLNKPREARGAVQQAKVVLDRIDPDASFAEATIYSRREWKELLDWLGKL